MLITIADPSQACFPCGAALAQLPITSLGKTGCHHRAVLDVEHWPDEVTVVSFRRRLVCTACGIIGADA